MTVVIALAGLAFLILIHEAGHFFTALAVGMRPRRFYIGFPPALAKTTRNGVEYGLGAIPLGGYVKIPGMHRPASSDVDVHFGSARYEAPQLLQPRPIHRRFDVADGMLEPADGITDHAAHGRGGFAFELHEEQTGHPGGFRDELQQRAVEQLERRWLQRHEIRDGFSHRAEIGESQRCAGSVGRNRIEAPMHRGDDREGAFGADQ